MRVVQNRVLRLLAVVVLLGTALAGTSEAMPTITLQGYSDINAGVGGTTPLDVFLGSLGPGIGGYNFRLIYDPNILKLIGVNSATLAPGGEMGANPFTFSLIDNTLGTFDGVVSLDATVPDAATAQGLQGTGFSMATFIFTGVGLGQSSITFGSGLFATTLSDYDANDVPFQYLNSTADICVGPSGSCATGTVPEPSSVSLMFVGVAGLAALTAMRRRFLTQV